MMCPSPLPLATKSFLNVRRTAGRDAARRSCQFVRVRLDLAALIGADMRVMCRSAKQLCALFWMRFRPQPRQEESVVVIVAAQSP